MGLHKLQDVRMARHAALFGLVAINKLPRAAARAMNVGLQKYFSPARALPVQINRFGQDEKVGIARERDAAAELRCRTNRTAVFVGAARTFLQRVAME